MCESHTIYQLCGHVKIKTIVQCADIIEKLIASGHPIAVTHHVCESSEMSDSSHVFPDICDKCKATGIVNEVMSAPARKLEILREWKEANAAAMAARKEQGRVRDDESDDSDESDLIRDLETFEPEPAVVRETITNAQASSASLSTPDVDSASTRSPSSSVTSQGTMPDLSQIKSRLIALQTRTERLLTKIHASKPPTLAAKPTEEK